MFEDSSSDAENHVHGSRPQKRNSANREFLSARRHHVREDERVDQQQQQRIDEGPEKAENRAPITGLQLSGDETLDERRDSAEVEEVIEHDYARLSRRPEAVRATS